MVSVKKNYNILIESFYCVFRNELFEKSIEICRIYESSGDR